MNAFDSDLRSLAAKAALSRREVVVTSLATGFALAVQPVCAQTTITTDANGLEAGEVQIKTQNGDIPAYRAMPASGEPFPVALVVQEIFGVHEHIKDVCRRFAKLGYLAIAPELYARQGDVSKTSDVQQIIREVVSKVPDEQVMSDLDATVAYAKETGKADTARLGITGFCWGGRIVWLYAAHNPNLKAGVAWYGRLVGDPSPTTPKHPVALASELKAPVLGLYGGLDQGIPVQTTEQMKEACEAAHKTCDFVVYPEAPHAFHADYRPSYRADEAKDGWRRLQAWFKQHGAA
jgi:carboxymethylenebutenolidase